MVSFRDLITERFAAVLIVTPIVPLILSLILVAVAIFSPWWVTVREVTYGELGLDVARATSEISLWAHLGCEPNESWEDICGMPEQMCVSPPAPPPEFLLPWTPAPEITEEERAAFKVVELQDTVRLKSMFSGLYLEVPSGSSGDRVVQKNSDSEGSRWFVQYVSDSEVMLMSTSTGFYLHVSPGLASALDPVIQLESQSDGSKWEVEYTTKTGLISVVTLKSVRSGLYLHVSNNINGDPVIQLDSDSDGSKWQIEPVEQAPLIPQQASQGSAAVTFQPTTVSTTKDEPFRCINGGTECDLPPATTTEDPLKWGTPPPFVGSGSGASFGDNSARVGEETVQSNEDKARIPPTEAPPPVTTPVPTFEPEVITVTSAFKPTTAPPTSWKPKGFMADVWGSVNGDGQGISYGEDLKTELNPMVAPRPTGPPPSPPYAGVQIAAEKCPVEGLNPLLHNPKGWGPDAGEFICFLKSTCGNLLPVRFSLFAAGGIITLNILVLLIFGSLRGNSTAVLIVIFDWATAYVSVVCMAAAIISLLAVLISADTTGLTEPLFEPNYTRQQYMDGPGVACAVGALLTTILGFIQGSGGLAIRIVISRNEATAIAAAKAAAKHAQDAIEATEEWKLQQDYERDRKKPAPLGWRSVRVAPELDYAVEDKFPQPGSECGSTAYSGSETALSESERATMEAMVLAITGPSPTQPNVLVNIPEQEDYAQPSLPIRIVSQEAPSAVVETCIRNFMSQPEGAVYKQHFAQPTTTPMGTARGEDWVPKVSRANGRTYFVNAETGETRWTPPSSARGALSERQESESCVSGSEVWEDSEAGGPPQAAGKELWKKIRRKNGTIVSVRRERHNC